MLKTGMQRLTVKAASDKIEELIRTFLIDYEEEKAIEQYLHGLEREIDALELGSG